MLQSYNSLRHLCNTKLIIENTMGLFTSTIYFIEVLLDIEIF
jgi:hypothetical protein